jgi:CHAD domain-containing protein
MKKLNQRKLNSDLAQDIPENSAPVRYFDARIKAIKVGARNSRLYFMPEAIHDLRVEIKRIRSLFELVESISPAFDARSASKKLRPLFQAAGLLRDIDVCQEIIADAMGKHNLSEYFNYLKEREFVYRPALTNVINDLHFSSLSEVRKEMMKALESVTAEQIRTNAFYRANRLMDRILRLASRKNVSDVILHEIRKTAKSARYTLEVCSEIAGSDSRRKRLIERLKAAHQSLGRWRDFAIVSQSIDKFNRHDAIEPLFDKTAYTLCMKELYRQTERLKLEAVKKLGFFLKRRSGIFGSKGRFSNYKRGKSS